MYESSSVFALFWNILRNQLPKEINEDFEAWLQGAQMVRMDTMGSQDSTQGTYTVKYGEDKFEFHGVDMPPPSGAFGTNYTRSVEDKCIIYLSNNMPQIYTPGSKQPQVCSIMDDYAGSSAWQ